MIEILVASPSTRAVGLTLLHFLWQGSIIGAAAALVLANLRSASASVRYVVACVALTAMVMTPAMTFAALVRPTTVGRSVTPTEAPTPSYTSSAVIPSAALPTSVFQTPIDGVFPVVTCAWGLGVLMLTLRLARGWLLAQRVRRSADNGVGDVLVRATRIIAARLGIAHPVHVAQSCMVDVPTLVGWIRPAILMPASALALLSPWQLEAIITHELAHVRRHDYLVNALQNVMETLLFFHPAVWWLSDRVRLEREHCCDDVVVSMCGGALSYARALATLEEARQLSASFGLAATDGPLIGRIQRLVGAPPQISRRSTLVPTLICVAILGTVGVTISRGEPAAARVPAEGQEAPRLVAPEPLGTAAARTVAPGPVAAQSVPSPRELGQPSTNLRQRYAELMSEYAQVTATRDESLVRDAEMQLRQAKLSNDVTMLAQLLDDSYVAVNQVGETKDKPQAIEMYRTLGFRNLELRIAAVRVTNEAATVTGTQYEVRSNGSDAMLFARVWTRRADGRWRLLSSSQFRDPRVSSIGTNFGVAEGVTVEPLAGAQQTPPTTSPAPSVPLQFDMVVSNDAVTMPPQKIKNVAPVYPEAARAANVQGVVIVTATIDATGHVINPRILRSAPMFDQAALEAVSQWVYVPATLNGQAVAVSLTMMVSFAQPAASSPTN